MTSLMKEDLQPALYYAEMVGRVRGIPLSFLSEGVFDCGLFLCSEHQRPEWLRPKARQSRSLLYPDRAREVNGANGHVISASGARTKSRRTTFPCLLNSACPSRHRYTFADSQSRFHHHVILSLLFLYQTCFNLQPSFTIDCSPRALNSLKVRSRATCTSICTSRDSSTSANFGQNDYGYRESRIWRVYSPTRTRPGVERCVSRFDFNITRGTSSSCMISF